MESRPNTPASTEEFLYPWAFLVGPIGGAIVATGACIQTLSAMPGSDSTDSGFLWAIILPQVAFVGVIVGAVLLMLSVGAAHVVRRLLPLRRWPWIIAGALAHGILTTATGLVVHAAASVSSPSVAAPVAGGVLAALVAGVFLAFGSEAKAPTTRRVELEGPLWTAGISVERVLMPGSGRSVLAPAPPPATVSAWLRRKEDERRARRHGGVTGR